MYHQAAAVAAAVTLALCNVATCQLSCDSQLRLLPQFAHLFTHCDCTYSQWSEWMVLRTTAVPISQCPSGRAMTEERQRSVVSGNCDASVEQRTVCEPELVDQIILSLGLGSNGRHITPTFLQSPIYNNYYYIEDLNFTVSVPPNGFTRQTRQTRSICEASQVCQHVTVPHGKRAVREQRKRPRINRRSRSTIEPELLAVDPIPFSISEHGARYRRQTNDCQPNGIQYILFVLDTSGSIDENEFNRVTGVLGDLLVFFCRPIQIAVMTFDHEYYAEFCFNCHGNTCGGRSAAREAMRNIDYGFNRDRIRYTHTGGAAQCVCDFMLSTSCGVDPIANCLDVVFLTDGQSNDPARDVCSDIRCLHNRFGVNTYAIGIDDALPEELECISDAEPGEYHLFNFLDFQEFEARFREIVDVLVTGAVNPNGDQYTCIDPQVDLATENCLP